MPNLWKWLMQANEKNAFAISMCVLLVSAGASAWLFTSTAKDGGTPAVDPETRVRPPASHIQTSYIGIQKSQANHSRRILKPFHASSSAARLAE